MSMYDSNEAGLVGVILHEPAVLAEVVDLVSDDDFEHGAFLRIYRCAVELWRKGEPFTGVDVVSRLSGPDPDIADRCFTDNPPLPYQAPSYARLVRKDAALRTLRKVSDLINEKAAGYEVSPNEVAEEAAAALHALMGGQKKDLVTIGEGVAGFFADLENRASGDVPPGIPSPYHSLNRLICGFEPGMYYIIAARPSVGKSVMAVQIAQHAAEQGHRSLYCNLESCKEALIRRMVAASSGVSTPRLKMGVIKPDEWTVVRDACAALGNLEDKITIWDAPAATPNQLRAECMRAANTGGLDLVIIDYVQLMRSGLRMPSRHLEVEHISAELKAIGKQLRVPIIALAQLNRNVMQGDMGEMREPQMSDLKESGSLEQDADVIIFPHRVNLEAEETLLKVGKQKDGPTGAFNMRLNRREVKFEEL